MVLILIRLQAASMPLFSSIGSFSFFIQIKAPSPCSSLKTSAVLPSCAFFANQTENPVEDALPG